MADNIRNFSDYKKKVNLEKQETEEINIEIQDPLDFLSASEASFVVSARQMLIMLRFMNSRLS